MKRYVNLILALSLLISSCSTKKTITGDGVVRDGSSYEKAIMINDAHERQGVNDEYAWVRTNYPNSKTTSQSLAYHDKKPYDILHITTVDGKAISVYFDIDKFYGHF